MLKLLDVAHMVEQVNSRQNRNKVLLQEKHVITFRKTKVSVH